MRGYWQLGSNPRFLLLALASGVRSTACSCTCWRRRSSWATHLGLAPTQFFWFFMLTIAGIMGGAWPAAGWPGKIAPKRQIRHGFVIMLLVSVLNVAANLLFAAARGLGAAPDRGVRLRLGADGAGGDAAGDDQPRHPAPLRGGIAVGDERGRGGL